MNSVIQVAKLIIMFKGRTEVKTHVKEIHYIVV